VRASKRCAGACVSVGHEGATPSDDVVAPKPPLAGTLPGLSSGVTPPRAGYGPLQPSLLLRLRSIDLVTPALTPELLCLLRIPASTASEHGQLLPGGRTPGPLGIFMLQTSGRTSAEVGQLNLAPSRARQGPSSWNSPRGSPVQGGCALVLQRKSKARFEGGRPRELGAGVPLRVRAWVGYPCRLDSSSRPSLFGSPRCSFWRDVAEHRRGRTTRSSPPRWRW